MMDSERKGRKLWEKKWTMKNRGRAWRGLALLALLWPGVLQAASPYATMSGAGLFHVTDQTINVWGDADDDGSPDVIGTQHNVDVDVIQGPDQDWSGTANIRPGLVHYDNFLGPRDQCTSGWGGAAAGGSLILGFDQDFADGSGIGTYTDYNGVDHPLPEGVDFIVEGFGFSFNKAFSDERGTVTIYVADAAYNPVVSASDPVTGLRSITGDDSRWVKISGWLGRQGDGTWAGNPNHNYASAPGAYGLYLWGDLAGSGLSSARYIKFELGDGNHYTDPWTGDQTTGRALFIDAVKSLYHRPEARAGNDRRVNEETRVVLDGSDSEDADGDPLSFRWRQTAGVPVTLSDPTSPKPEFTSSFIGDVTFELTVRDGELDAVDTITITVVETGLNQSPVAEAGADIRSKVGDTVILDGTASADPDGDLLSFFWEQVSGPEVELADATSPTAHFTAPNIPVAPVFRLTVTDPSGLVDTDTVRVQINRPPIVDLSRTEETGTENLLFTLDASRSWDPDLDDLQYDWTQLSGPEVELSDPHGRRPTFMVPERAGEEMVFQAVVSDGRGFALSGTVTVTIRQLYIIDTDNPATSAWQVGSFSYRSQTLDKAKEALSFPDCTPDGQGDASGFPDGYVGDITLRFNVPVADGEGNDLSIFHLGAGEAEVQASIDGETWVSLGYLAPAGGGGVRVQRYDLSDFPQLSLSRVISVQFLKIVKTAHGGARYIDGVIGHHTALTALYASYMQENDGPVDWVGKKSDGGANALGKPDYDPSTPGIGNCSGWMVNSGHLIAGFDQPLVDRDGPDLFIHHFGQGVTDADIALGAVDGATTVEVSEDGSHWIFLGDLPLGANGGNRLDVDTFDFGAFPELGDLDANGQYRVAQIRFVRINKNGRGYGAGKFIDAIEGRFGSPGLGNPAGGDVAVDEGASVTLGRKNPARDDFDDTVYLWEQMENGSPSVVLSQDNVKNPTFVTPPLNGDSAPLMFKLTRVNENEFGVSVSVVTIDVHENGITGFPDDAVTFHNPLTGQAMALLPRRGNLVFYGMSDPDYKYSDGHIPEMRNRPKNLIYGMLDFTMRADSEGKAVVEVLLPEPAPADYRWYKYAAVNGWSECMRGSVPDAPEDGAVFDAGRRTVTVTITDNGPLDDDTERDGIVRDPSGLGIPCAWHDDGGGGGGCFISGLVQW